MSDVLREIVEAQERIRRAPRPMKEPVVVCHPDDVNLADVKALAAQHDASVIANRYTPRGQMYLMDADVCS